MKTPRGRKAEDRLLLDNLGSCLSSFFPCLQTIYTSFRSDFGVSAWGKDFQPTLHHGVLGGATAQGYLPTVDVFLPVCNEPTVLLANSWSFAQKLDYPTTHLTVHVLDDGASDEVRDLAAAHVFQCEQTVDR